MVDLHQKANGIRRLLGVAAYVENNQIYVPIGETTRVTITEEISIGHMKKLPSLELISKRKIEELRKNPAEAKALFSLPEINMEMLLMLCNILTRRTFTPVYMDGVKLVFCGTPVKNLTELRDLVLGQEPTQEEAVKALKLIMSKADNSVAIQGGKACVLDGVAYVAVSYDDYLKVNPQIQSRVALLGYLKGSEIVWDRISQERYTPVNVEGSKTIKILNIFNKEEISEVYRIKQVGIGIKEYQYPVAILEDGALAYFIKRGKKAVK